MFSTLCGALFGVLALRASGIGFLMITLALGQIVWGIAYRANTLTDGDNGLRFPARPHPFGIDIASAPKFYWFTLIVFALALFVIWRLTQSPFGAALQGARDQPRRMRMLGHNVWLIQWFAFVLASFWGSVAGLLYVYYNLFISPHAISLQQSAEVLLMAILGGASTFTGPIVGAVIITLVKNLVSSYVDRWNTLLGAIFVIVILFMPFGLVPGRAAMWARWQRAGEEVRSGAGQAGVRAMTPALEVIAAEQALRRPAGHARVSLTVMPGERRLIIGPNGAGKTTLFNLITGDLTPDAGSVKLFGQELLKIPTQQRVHLGLARTYQILTLFPKETLTPQRRAGAARPRQDALERVDHARPARRQLYDAAREALALVGLGDVAHRTVAETSYGERRRLEMAMALAQKPKVLLLDEPLAGLQPGRARPGARAAGQGAARRHHRDDRARHGLRPRLRGAHHAAALRRGDRRRHARRSGGRSATKEVYLGE